MFEQQLVREAPFVFPKKGNDPTRPDASAEPVLRVDNIQGNIVGFSKDHQTLLFLKITNVEYFRGWLGRFAPFVATAHEVLLFNRLFKEIRRRRKVETHTVQATWINIAFSYKALHSLTDDAADFTDAAFKQGMAARAVSVLGDPKSKKAEGNPHNWVFGGPKNEADVVIIVASDSDEELDDEVGRIEESIYSGRTIEGKHALSGAQIIYKQLGATLPPPLTGHEHFGFLDGVSQPGVRGRVSEDVHDVLTPRQNPNDREQGKPGQDLLWPGEFIFGYERQKGAAEIGKDGKPKDELNTEPGPVAHAGPAWADDGSFLVIRRLRQEVGAFHKFLEDEGQKAGLSRDHFGAKLVGRWPSGAPIMRAPDADNPPLGNDDCANNHFEFGEDGDDIPPGVPPNQNDCVDNKFPQAKADTTGAVCPFAGHIRKTYPRDDTSDSIPDLEENTTQTHRLLRRGIPFGDPYFPPPDPDKSHDTGNRGLVFAAYQTSIENQFEFVQSQWVNNADFKDADAGHDFIIGQSNGPGGKRTRRFSLLLKQEGGTEETKEITTEDDWVIPTGGGYFFQPSLAALYRLAGLKAT